MLATLIIVFRETIEAGLIVGIVLAATQGVPGRGVQVALGVLGGLAGACLVALFAGSIADAFAGSGQELLNAGVLGLAAVMLAWHGIWMARHGRAMAADMRALGADVQAGTRRLSALSIVVGVAVLREGAEVVLFLYGIAAGGDANMAGMLAGGAAGVALGGGLTVLTHAGLVRLPSRALFAVTYWLIALIAAGMAAQAAFFAQAGGLIARWDTPLWDSSGVLAEKSLVGRILHTLAGYSDSPTGLQLAAYLAVLAFVVLGSQAGSARPRQASGSVALRSRKARAGSG